jgi:hypothetical protein
MAGRRSYKSAKHRFSRRNKTKRKRPKNHKNRATALVCSFASTQNRTAKLIYQAKQPTIIDYSKSIEVFRPITCYNQPLPL